jgi:hypothetical protein
MCTMDSQGCGPGGQSSARFEDGRASATTVIYVYDRW